VIEALWALKSEPSRLSSRYTRHHLGSENSAAIILIFMNMTHSSAVSKVSIYVGKSS